ncbi:MAG TPA: glycogen synthase GlgA [Candidatus Binatia bacterium]|jgi:starch synthase|nr:glycogen synthase GlgA [Candidatus Binatia bacterium]
MKIAMIASEVSPFAKTGGLADVVGTLSVALERLGHEVCVIAPAYRCVFQSEFALRESPIKLSVPVSDRQQEATVVQSALGNGVLVYLIRADRYFDRESLYGTAAGDYPDNAERFVFFSRAALELLRHQPVDVVHCHDWQTALAIVFLKTQTSRYLEMAGAKSVFTLHNLGFQGIFQPHDWDLLNLDAALFTPQLLEFYGNINFLKGGLVLADKITTVSPSYAQEIMTAAQGFGLEGVVRQRAADLVGILNGVDYSLWNPWTDPFITPHYGEKSLPLKDECKRKLRRIFKLPDNNHSPVIGMISRLTAQKGFDLVEAIFDLLMQRDVQFILLGTGETRFEQFFGAAVTRYADRVGVRIGFDESLAHQIEAGADLFLMPSRYEPCGLNQMFSLKYGTIPIVRAVGGLKDTVQQCDTDAETGTGFVFEPYEAQALLDAIDHSLQVFHNRTAWTTLQRRAMAMDFSWERSAKLYANLYRKLMH